MAALENQPELYEDLAEVWDAFTHLSRRRQAGFGPAPIAETDIKAWLDIHRVPRGVAQQEYEHLIAALDDVWLRWQNEHGKAKPDS